MAWWNPFSWISKGGKATKKAKAVAGGSLGGAASAGVLSTVGGVAQTVASAAIASVEFLFNFLRTMIGILPKSLQMLIFFIGGITFLGLIVQFFVAANVVCANEQIYYSDDIVKAGYAKLKDVNVFDAIKGPYLSGGEWIYEIESEGEVLKLHTKLYGEFIAFGRELGFEDPWRDEIFVFLPLNVVDATDYTQVQSAASNLASAAQWGGWYAQGASLILDKTSLLEEFFICKADEETMLGDYYIPANSCYAKQETFMFQQCDFVASYSYPMLEESDDYGTDIYVTLSFVDGGDAINWADFWSYIFFNEGDIEENMNSCTVRAENSVDLEITEDVYVTGGAALVEKQAGYVQGGYAPLLSFVFALLGNVDSRGNYVEESNDFIILKDESAYEYCRGSGSCNMVTYSCDDNNDDVKVRIFGIDIFNMQIIWVLTVLFLAFYLLKFLRIL